MTIRLAKRSRKISSICARVMPSGNLRGSQFFLVVFAMFIFQHGRLFPNYSSCAHGTMLRRLLPNSEASPPRSIMATTFIMSSLYDDMMKVVAMFDRGGDASELGNVLEL